MWKTKAAATEAKGSGERSSVGGRRMSEREVGVTAKDRERETCRGRECEIERECVCVRERGRETYMEDDGEARRKSLYVRGFRTRRGREKNTVSSRKTDQKLFY